jgi:DNA polymerase-3 subunit epsilon
MSRYVAFDLETTGVNSFHDVPVSYGFVEQVTEGEIVHTVTDGGLVNPGRSIPPGATAVHGITNEMVADAVSLAVSSAAIIDKLADVWFSGGAIVGMNLAYDLTMVDALCRRVFNASLAERGVEGPVYDILVIDRHFDRYRKGKRTLEDLCLQYHVVLDGAHSAVADAQASLSVFRAMLELYPEIPAIPTSEVNASLRAWHQDWLRSFSTFLEGKGRAPINAGQYEWPIHHEG